MKRLNVMVSDSAKLRIIAYQKKKKFQTLDETVDSFILEQDAKSE